MPLSKGAKIAIGCLIAVVLAGGMAVAVVVGFAWWGAGKARQMAERLETEQKDVDRALQKANANPFTEPADGVIQEERLLRFLAVRKSIHDEVYLKHKDMIEAQAKKKDPDLSAMAKLPFIVMELHASKARALAREGMSEAEFGWLFKTVYGGLVMAGTTGSGTGSGDAVRASARAMAEQAEQAAAAANANPSVSPEARRQLREAADRAREEAARAEQAAGQLDIPPANLALFRKHRDEILKYTMGGLELIPF
jgi:hypothetical protein